MSYWLKVIPGLLLAFVLFNSIFPKTPFPLTPWGKVPFITILPVPPCIPELYTFPVTLIILPLSFSVPVIRLKSFETFMVGCVPAKLKAVPAGLSMVSLFKESGAARSTVNTCSPAPLKTVVLVPAVYEVPPDTEKSLPMETLRLLAAKSP